MYPAGTFCDDFAAAVLDATTGAVVVANDMSSGAPDELLFKMKNPPMSATKKQTLIIQPVWGFIIVPD
jgi:hypothetical protein